jgi:hypothetical protein
MSPFFAAVGAGRTYWPEGVPRVVTPEAFREAFATLGYQVCAGEELEPALGFHDRS